MYTNGTATVSTSPFDFLIRNKFINAQIFNLFQVFDHAHCVSGSVSLIQLLHPRARELTAFVTEFRFAGLYLFTVFNPAFYTRSSFTNINPITAWTLFLITKISLA